MRERITSGQGSSADDARINRDPRRILEVAAMVTSISITFVRERNILDNKYTTPSTHIERNPRRVFAVVAAGL